MGAEKQYEAFVDAFLKENMLFSSSGKRIESIEGLNEANERKDTIRKRMAEEKAVEEKYTSKPERSRLFGIRIEMLSLAARNMTNTYKDTYGAPEEMWRDYLRLYEILLRAFSEAEKEGA